MTVNIPLLRKAVEWAEAEAEKPPALCEWEQTVYVLPPERFELYGRSPECGTCYCIAGYIAAQADGPVVDEDTAGNRAQELLGISDFQSDLLFDGCNNIEDVRRIAEQIAGEPL